MKKFEPRYPSSLRYGAAGLGSYKIRILNALLAGEFPPGQQLFDFSAGEFARLSQGPFWIPRLSPVF